MSGLINQLRTISDDLNHLGVPWALVGALAVSVHGEPRTTRDIDLAVALEDRQAQRELIAKLLKLGYANEQLLMHVMPAHPLGVRLQSRGGGKYPLAVDLLFSSSGIENEIVTQAVKLEILPGVYVPVAARGHLIALKILSQNDTDRIRDKGDLQQLLRDAPPEEIQRANEATKMIQERSFSRGKDLSFELNEAIRLYKLKELPRA